MGSYKAPFPQQGSGIGLTKPAPLPPSAADFNCDHVVHLEHDPRARFGFEAVRCQKCGTKFHIPKGEAY